jgi:hypothetical protein
MDNNDDMYPVKSVKHGYITAMNEGRGTEQLDPPQKGIIVYVNDADVGDLGEIFIEMNEDGEFGDMHFYQDHVAFSFEDNLDQHIDVVMKEYIQLKGVSKGKTVSEELYDEAHDYANRVVRELIDNITSAAQHFLDEETREYTGTDIDILKL